MIERVIKTNLYEAVSNQITKLIKHGEWKPGDRIPGEIELSKTFGIGRSSMRESLKALELTGLLVSKPGIGTFVADDALRNIKNLGLFLLIENESSLEDLMETRLWIEPQLVQSAIERATTQDRKELKTILDVGIKSLENKEYSFDMGLKFHMKIAEIAGNQILCNFLESISNHLIAQRGEVILEHLSEYILNKEMGEHLDLYECFEKMKSEEGRKLMYSHIEDSLDRIRESKRKKDK
jgi:GntR family transcriptional repressor for pyruvate dehydrogenase complex